MSSGWRDALAAACWRSVCSRSISWRGRGLFRPRSSDSTTSLWDCCWHSLWTSNTRQPTPIRSPRLVRFMGSIWDAGRSEVFCLGFEEILAKKTGCGMIVEVLNWFLGYYYYWIQDIITIIIWFCECMNRFFLQWLIKHWLTWLEFTHELCFVNSFVLLVTRRRASRWWWLCCWSSAQPGITDNFIVTLCWCFSFSQGRNLLLRQIRKETWKRNVNLSLDRLHHSWPS